MKQKYSKKLPVSLDKYEYYYELFPDYYDKTRYSRFELFLGRINKVGNLEVIKAYESSDRPREFFIRIFDSIPDNIGRVGDLKEGELQYLANQPIRYIQDNSHHADYDVILESSLITGKDLLELLKDYPFVVDKYGNNIMNVNNPDAYYVASLVKKTESDTFIKLRQSKFELENNLPYPKTSSFILQAYQVRAHVDFTDTVEAKTYHTDVWDRHGGLSTSDSIDKIIKRLNLPLKVNYFDLAGLATIDNLEEEPHYVEYEGLCGYHVTGDVTLTITKDMIDYSKEALCKHFYCKIYEKEI